uniref:NADH-ubiquinone oxidoreductase chain 2 n=1 Tax=Fergusonina taylori TaxID=991131 RepID=H6TDM5_9MUSC|nr:NADH dehydrogenase subunit 2 [Fergusonina taylori]ADY85991.1 NADH dehydrogenase subunit 2 [Fergusonina taylori]
MFINSTKIMFLMILVMSTLVAISANSWLSAWMGLEINLLSFIPLVKDNTLMSSEGAMKYFLTQALASSVLLMSLIILSMKNSYMNFNLMNSNFLLVSALLTKMGAAPFHFWFPSMIENISWMNSLILMTWQKIAPLFLICNLLLHPIVYMSIILSAIFGAIGGLNQTSLRKLMAYSSINHLSWMLSTLYINENMMMNYFLFYSFMSFTLILMFMMFKVFFINQLFSLFFKDKILKLMIFTKFIKISSIASVYWIFPKVDSNSSNYFYKSLIFTKNFGYKNFSNLVFLHSFNMFCIHFKLSGTKLINSYLINFMFYEFFNILFIFFLISNFNNYIFLYNA